MSYIYIIYHSNDVSVHLSDLSYIIYDMSDIYTYIYIYNYSSPVRQVNCS